MRDIMQVELNKLNGYNGMDAKFRLERHLPTDNF